MTNSSERNYAFSYSVGTSRFVFDIVAESQADAEARVAAMAGAACMGAIIKA
jgi:hypothetical protein